MAARPSGPNRACYRKPGAGSKILSLNGPIFWQMIDISISPETQLCRIIWCRFRLELPALRCNTLQLLRPFKLLDLSAMALECEFMLPLPDGLARFPKPEIGSSNLPRGTTESIPYGLRQFKKEQCLFCKTAVQSWLCNTAHRRSKW